MNITASRRIALRGWLLAGLLLLVLAGEARAQTLKLLAPSIANEAGTLTARFGVAVDELPILKGELDDGLELRLRCDVTLSRDFDYWIDTHITSATFESRLRRDALAAEYVMDLPGRDKPLRDSDLRELLRRGWADIAVPLGPWDMLTRGHTYNLRLTNAMQDSDAPEGLSRYIYFWSWDAGADNSFQLKFTY